MKKILAGFIMDGKAGGIDKYLLNFLDIVSSEDIRVDFLTNKIDDNLKKKLGTYQAELYEIPNLRHPVAQYRTVRQILKNGQYDAVYFNISTAIDCIAAIAAKHEYVKRRMIHSHSSGNDCESRGKRYLFDSIHKLCRLVLWKYATEYYGCSKRAGEWLFPEKIADSDRFAVIYNAVDRKRYAYSSQVRKEVRRQLGLDERFVIGHTGNFCYQKNHGFLLDVFAEVFKRRPDAYLMLIGDGVRFEEIKKQAREAQIESSVLFLGRRTDADRLYQAMDVFVLPSNFEGLPIVGIEAQSSGLPCLMSSRITEEVKITEKCRFLPLASMDRHTAVTWAEAILQMEGERKEAEYLKEAVNYDLEFQKEQLKRLVQF